MNEDKGSEGQSDRESVSTGSHVAALTSHLNFDGKRAGSCVEAGGVGGGGGVGVFRRGGEALQLSTVLRHRTSFLAGSTKSGFNRDILDSTMISSL